MRARSGSVTEAGASGGASGSVVAPGVLVSLALGERNARRRSPGVTSSRTRCPLPIGTQHLALVFGVIAGRAPRHHADRPTHRADTAVSQADLHAAGMSRLGNGTIAIRKFR